MLFNSIEFAIFLPIVFCLYWFVTARNLRLQNAFVIVSSYFFYGWWDWRFLILILLSTVEDYFVAIQMHKTNDEQKRKMWLVFSIIFNLGILGFFKYFNFFAENLVEAFTLFGSHLNLTTLKIVLPIGISFYTFQTMSYTIDVYRRKLEPTRDFLAFAAFVSFFPLLVAGPIERATNLLSQFFIKRIFVYEQAVNGMRQILWGLFKKIVIADNCAIYVNQTFADSAAASSSTLILAAMLFAFQIYCDFSGYSDIAIGTARLFGFRAMRNFNFPYFSRDIAEFWRRWHISLTTWFRDYVYIPLGGSRVSKTKIIRNTFVIFLVSGFWHGANWTFLLWGAYHALLFLPLILLHQNRKFTDIVANNSRLPNIKELLQIICTFGLVCIGWIIFRAENMGQAVNYFLALFSANFMPLELMRSMYIPILSIIFMLTVEWIGRKDQYGLETFALKWKPIYRLAFYYALIALIFNYSLRNTAQEFIYFQF